MAEKKKENAQFVDNPLHTGVTKDPASTPGYFRILLPALAGRYILRWGNSSFGKLRDDIGRLFGHDLPSEPHKEAKAIIESAEALGDTLAADLKRRDLREIPADELDRFLEREDAQALKTSLSYHGLKPKVLREAVDHRVQYSILNPGDSQIKLHQSQWQDFKDQVRQEVGEHTLDRRYDYLLGLGSFLITAFYANRVASDVKKVYGETVAYELDKNPKDVTYGDLWHSENHLLEEMKHNFIKKNAGRVATDAVFFAGALDRVPGFKFLKKHAFSDLGVGIKGAQLVAEVGEKKSTIFEDLILLIDNKLNPLRGLGSPIVVSDVFDLYQKYTINHDPNETFRDALTSQNHDGRDWRQAQGIFRRITDLMNATYKYKHIGQGTGEAGEPADFALPKFLYLLGNGLIDTYKPENTLAYVEVANSYGIPAVKQLRRMLEKGVPLEKALEGYKEEWRQSVLAEAKEAAAGEEIRIPPPDVSPPTPAPKIREVTDHVPPQPQATAVSASVA